MGNIIKIDTSDSTKTNTRVALIQTETKGINQRTIHRTHSNLTQKAQTKTNRYDTKQNIQNNSNTTTKRIKTKLFTFFVVFQLTFSTYDL